MSYFDPVEMTAAELDRAYHGTHPKLCRLGQEFLVWTQDGGMLLDDAEFDVDFEKPSEDELADEDLDEPCWLFERNAPWPSEAEMERHYQVSLGADLALALHT